MSCLQGIQGIKKALLLTAGLLLTAPVCADNPQDPWEGYNRAMFSFNDTVDKYTLKPIAQGYRFITPDPVENGISRMFSNVGEVPNIINDLLQFKFMQAGNDTGRLLVNSTVGLLGFFDVAKHIGLEKSEGEDFGQTLAAWGVNEGPYFVIPFWGPSTLRDAPSRVVDAYMNPIKYIDHVPTRNQIYGASIISTRAELLEAEKFVRGDRYSFIRDVYLQRRKFLTSDGGAQDDSFGEFE